MKCVYVITSSNKEFMKIWGSHKKVIKRAKLLNEENEKNNFLPSYIWQKWRVQ